MSTNNLYDRTEQAWTCLNINMLAVMGRTVQRKEGGASGKPFFLLSVL